jgi:hypothetical protein
MNPPTSIENVFLKKDKNKFTISFKGVVTKKKKILQKK